MSILSPGSSRVRLRVVPALVAPAVTAGTLSGGMLWQVSGAGGYDGVGPNYPVFGSS
jgi:hypothetical protein